jgi:hypothetical protein
LYEDIGAVSLSVISNFPFGVALDVHSYCYIAAPSLEPLKSAYAKLAFADEPSPTPRLKQRPLGMLPNRR